MTGARTPRGRRQPDARLHLHLRVDEVLRAPVDVVTEVPGADQAAVTAWEPDRRRLAVRAARGFGGESLARMAASGEAVAL